MVGKTFEQVDLHYNCFNRVIACPKQLPSHTCDVLITDVKMPEMNDIKLLAKAKLMFPSLPVFDYNWLWRYIFNSSSYQ
jgi:DNA-binding NtrC family response regulator